MHDPRFALSRRRWLGSAAAFAATASLARLAQAGAKGPTGDALWAQPGVVLDVAAAGAWDSKSISTPRVIREADGTWKMWYHGRDANFDKRINLPTGHIGLATSRDGIAWTRVKGPLPNGAVMSPSEDPAAWDSGHVGIGDIRRTEDGYEMWYFAGDRNAFMLGPRALVGFPTHVGRAVSKDGLNWRRVPGPQNGAWFRAGAPGSFDQIYIGWPQMLRDADGTMNLYYHTLAGPERFVAALAVSKDGGQTWDRKGPILRRGPAGDFDEGGVACRQVFTHNGKRYMVFEAFQATNRSCIGLAESADGLAWTKIRGPQEKGSILAAGPPQQNRWDGAGLGTPWIVPAGDGRLFMYFVGATENPNPQPGVMDENAITHRFGLAVCDGKDLTRWKRIREA
jgi:hypothetical protein